MFPDDDSFYTECINKDKGGKLKRVNNKIYIIIKLTLKCLYY